MSTLSALSFWQPYAWLIVNGHADVDSRMWAPTESRIGTRIAIHSAKRKMTAADYEDFLEIVRANGIKKYPLSAGAFDYGMLVGTVKIDGVTKTSKSYFAHKGYFHWLLSGARKITPAPIKGQRGWFRVEIS